MTSHASIYVRSHLTERYAAVGVLEDMETTMRVLASRLPAFFGKPFVPLAAHTAHANANPAKNPPLDETTAAILRRRLDLEELEHLHKAVTSNLEHQAAACTVQAPQQVQVPNAAKQGFDGELCLYSLMFGFKAWQAILLPDFLASIAGAPVKVVFVGDTPPPRSVGRLPENVEWRVLTMDQLSSSLENFFKVEPGTFPTAGNLILRKFGCDYKPLVPIALPELVQGFRWFGWVDNDMVFSGLALRDHVKRLTACNASMHSGSKNISWGPLTLLNTHAYFSKVVPYMRSFEQRKKIIEVLALQQQTFFDEWGQMVISDGYGHGLGLEYSFSGIVNSLAQSEPSFITQCEGLSFLEGTQHDDAGDWTPCIMNIDRDSGLSVLNVRGLPASFCHLRERKSNYSRCFTHRCSGDVGEGLGRPGRIL